MNHASGRLKALFHQASELLPSRRREFLDSACGSDTSLREELETLLAARQEMGEYLAQPTIGAAHAGEPADEHTPGFQIGPHTLVDLIGEGGFGVVYKAQQREPVRRTVALKIIKLGMDTRQVIARFEQERQALALMDHPGIAKVLDAGATDTGRPYFVMELVQGEPITHYCDAHRLGIRERLEVFTQVCHAVQHAHQKGIIHRDLKPSNMLVTIADGKPVPKIIDFGIAKATGPRLTEQTLVTEQRALIGTPEYMSPEQAEMGAVDIDTRTDIYSLGVLLYELLTGVTPFESKKLRSAAWGELQRIIREVEPPRPSTRISAMTQALSEIAEKRGTQPARLRGLIRGDLDWIVMKAIEKDRSRRYETASALAVDIRRHLDGEPVSAAPPSTVYRVGKFLRRHRVQVVAGSLVAASLLVAVVGTTTFALREGRRARETERVADFQARLLSEIEVPKLGDRLRQDILAEAEDGWNRQRRGEQEIAHRRERLNQLLADSNFTNTAIKSLDRAIFERSLLAIDRDFADQPLVKARLLQRVADSCRRLSLLNQAALAQSEALRIRRQVRGKVHPETLESLEGMARVLFAQGNRSQATPYAREAREGCQHTFGKNHARTVEATYLLASLRQRAAGGENEAESLLREVFEWQRLALGENDPRTLETKFRLGDAIFFREDNRFWEAASLIESSTEGLRRLLGDDDPTTFAALQQLASIRCWQGRLAEAEKLLGELWPVKRRQLGDDNSATWDTAVVLGQALLDQGQVSKAEPDIEDGVSGLRRIRGATDHQTLNGIESLANLRLQQGRLGEAEAAAREALEGWEEGRTDVWSGKMYLKLRLATILEKTGMPDKVSEADRIRAECLNKFKTELGPRHPRTLGAMNWVAWNLYLSGRAADGESLAREAVQGFRDAPVTTNTGLDTDMMDAVGILAFILRDTGRPGAALPLFEQIRRERGPQGSVKHLLAVETWVGHAKCLLMLQRFADAEQELLECTKTLSATGWRNMPIQVTKGLVAVYDAWHTAYPGAGHDIQAAEWRRRLPANADLQDPPLPTGWGG